MWCNGNVLRTIILEKCAESRSTLASLLRKHNFSVIETEACESAFRHLVTLKPCLFIYGENKEGFNSLEIAYFIRNVIKAKDCKLVYCYEDDQAVNRKLSETRLIDYFIPKANIVGFNKIIEQYGLTMLNQVAQTET